VQDPEFKERALWEGMTILRPWGEIPADVLAVEPSIIDNEQISSAPLSDEQKEVLKVRRASVAPIFAKEQHTLCSRFSGVIFSED